MRTEIDVLLADAAQVASRAQLLTIVSRAALDDEIRRGRLVAVFPRAYARPWDADGPRVRLAAALASVGGDVALSHLTALAQWDLPVAAGAPLHVTAFQPRHPRGVPGELVVHRTLLPLNARLVAGFATVRLEIAVVTSWPLLRAADQRAPVIEGARRGLLAPHTLLRTAEVMTWVRGVRELRQLVGQVLAGCESELELWGYTNVFAVPGLDHAIRQHPVCVGRRDYRLDLAFEAERVAVELDGRAYHAKPDQWERDIARDLALATAGWQTIRLSHRRLTYDVDGCRRDVLAVLDARRLRAG
jgi:very-short-patch-repair endonuclease